jgi:hypothetical protein
VASMDDYQLNQCQLPEAQGPLATLLHDLLSTVEQEKINQQFKNECRPDSQVLWSGIPHPVAQAWAKNRNFQTLSTAMGPLMDVQHPSCLKRTKSPMQWSVYMKGASALFAYHIARHSSKVTVLSPPPPITHNPNGYTNYQIIEEPILKGVVGGYPIQCVQMAHPTVKGAEAFTYQSWPTDRTEEWTGRFSHSSIPRTLWRTVSMKPAIQNIITIVASAESGIFYAASVASLTSDADMLAKVIAYIKEKQKASSSLSKSLLRI